MSRDFQPSNEWSGKLISPMKWRTRVQLRAMRLHLRRGMNPIREARRQHEIARMSNRITHYEARYRTVVSNGEIVAQIYLRHVPVRARFQDGG